jgi:hypothetical protein
VWNNFPRRYENFSPYALSHISKRCVCTKIKSTNSHSLSLDKTHSDTRCMLYFRNRRVCGSLSLYLSRLFESDCTAQLENKELSFIHVTLLLSKNVSYAIYILYVSSPSLADTSSSRMIIENSSQLLVRARHEIFLWHGREWEWFCAVRMIFTSPLKLIFSCLKRFQFLWNFSIQKKKKFSISSVENNNRTHIPIYSIIKLCRNMCICGE